MLSTVLKRSASVLRLPLPGSSQSMQAVKRMYLTDEVLSMAVYITLTALFALLGMGLFYHERHEAAAAVPPSQVLMSIAPLCS